MKGKFSLLLGALTLSVLLFALMTPTPAYADHALDGGVEVSCVDGVVEFVVNDPGNGVESLSHVYTNAFALPAGAISETTRDGSWDFPATFYEDGGFNTGDEIQWYMAVESPDEATQTAAAGTVICEDGPAIGPPAWANPAEGAGPPEHANVPDHAGPPEGAGPPSR